jgi:hypothetical protein
MRRHKRKSAAGSVEEKHRELRRQNGGGVWQAASDSVRNGEIL